MATTLLDALAKVFGYSGCVSAHALTPSLHIALVANKRVCGHQGIAQFSSFVPWGQYSEVSRKHVLETVYLLLLDTLLLSERPTASGLPPF